MAGYGSGMLNIGVNETFPEQMKKADLVTELTKFKVQNINSMSLEEMRVKFCELKMPLRAARE
jgi:hypothetical protein